VDRIRKNSTIGRQFRYNIRLLPVDCG